jgi:hypothetical protein
MILARVASDISGDAADSKSPAMPTVISRAARNTYGRSTQVHRG